MLMNDSVDGFCIIDENERSDWILVNFSADFVYNVENSGFAAMKLPKTALDLTKQIKSRIDKLCDLVAHQFLTRFV